MNPHESLVSRVLELVSDQLPNGMSSISQEFRHNMSAMLKESLGRMDLVTREEFDIQQKVLARTRQQLDELQQQIDLLERSLKQNARKPSQG